MIETPVTHITLRVMDAKINTSYQPISSIWMPKCAPTYTCMPLKTASCGFYLGHYCANNDVGSALTQNIWIAHDLYATVEMLLLQHHTDFWIPPNPHFTKLQFQRIILQTDVRLKAKKAQNMFSLNGGEDRSSEARVRCEIPPPRPPLAAIRGKPYSHFPEPHTSLLLNAPPPLPPFQKNRLHSLNQQTNSFAWSTTIISVSPKAKAGRHFLMKIIFSDATL